MAEEIPLPKCFKCEKPIECAVKPDSNEDYWACPCGLCFTGGGNFGSTVYDRLMDGVYVEVVICDDCLKRHKHLLRERNK